ncbi:hypothetical protein EDD34_0268 [Myceligenerans xiligouense]|uniref:Uncharacterized protein n=1 Tax=Myceligenerans xiligouense TaxID=253184 RepID=A0A3N4ZFW5_9MICO|nr:hypothetical protein EDD34_0268 [Myceligenerans xiligouense]
MSQQDAGARGHAAPTLPPARKEAARQEGEREP